MSLSTDPNHGIVSTRLPVKPALVANACRAAMCVMVSAVLDSVEVTGVSGPHWRANVTASVMNVAMMHATMQGPSRRRPVSLRCFAPGCYANCFEDGHSVALNNNSAALRLQIR